MSNEVDTPAFFDIANGSLMFILCGAVVLLVFIQAVLFLRKAYNRGKELGIETTKLNKIMINSGLFSIVPSIPILISYVTIMKSMGKYFPWLRLSVVGSGTYEYIAANTAAEAMNYSGIQDLAISEGAFVGIMFVITICILGGPITATLFMKRIEKMTKLGAEKKAGFASKVPGAMFAGMVCTLFIPQFLSFHKGEGQIRSNPTGVAVFLISAISVIGLSKLAKKKNIAVLHDFAFPIAMLIGMGFAMLLNGIAPEQFVWLSM